MLKIMTCSNIIAGGVGRVNGEVVFGAVDYNGILQNATQCSEMQGNTMQCKQAIQYGHALVVRTIVEVIEDEAFDEQDNNKVIII